MIAGPARVICPGDSHHGCASGALHNTGTDMRFAFRHHVIDADLPKGRYAQTLLADLSGEGRLDFVMGQQYGTLFRYEYEAPDRWKRSILGEDSPSVAQRTNCSASRSSASVTSSFGAHISPLR